MPKPSQRNGTLSQDGRRTQPEDRRRSSNGNSSMRDSTRRGESAAADAEMRETHPYDVARHHGEAADGAHTGSERKNADERDIAENGKVPHGQLRRDEAGRDERRRHEAGQEQPRRDEAGQDEPRGDEHRRHDAGREEPRGDEHRRHEAGQEQPGTAGRPRPLTGTPPLSGALQDLVQRTLDAHRAAEGQNVFGGYGASGLTPAIQRIAAQLPAGGLAPGSHAHTLKQADRFAAKLARLIARNPGRSAGDLARSISDGVRYAFAFDPGYYTDGTWLVHRKLKAQGFELEVRRNRWESSEYKGIWTRWRDPAHDLCFEVQFHTAISWAIVQRTYPAYVQITSPETSPADRALLRARQVAAAAEAKSPPGSTEIADFRLAPR
ncbi:MAG TPA: hypothetical protein VGI58_01140 [Streptosporangiaceae bacterium]